MLNYGKIAVLAGLLVPGAALAQISLGDTLGVSASAIVAKLEAQGYTVTEFEIEEDEGEIEVEAIKDGIHYEIELSQLTGEVLEIEEDDED